MRKVINLFLIVFVFCLLVSCKNEAREREFVENVAFEQVSINSPKDIDKYIIDKGYEILESEGKIDEYKLEKKKVYDNWQIWAVQYAEPSNYIGKVISDYSYTIKNHPLDNESPNKKTNLWIMVCENKIIGGYSNSDYKGVDPIHLPAGGCYSLEGKNFEDIKNIDFGTWRDKFIKKYQ